MKIDKQRHENWKMKRRIEIFNKFLKIIVTNLIPRKNSFKLYQIANEI